MACLYTGHHESSYKWLRKNGTKRILHYKCLLFAGYWHSDTGPTGPSGVGTRSPTQAEPEATVQGKQSDQGLLGGEHTDLTGEDGAARTHRCGVGRPNLRGRAGVGVGEQWGAGERVYPGPAPLVGSNFPFSEGEKGAVAASAGERGRCACRLRRGRVGPDDGWMSRFSRRDWEASMCLAAWVCRSRTSRCGL